MTTATIHQGIIIELGDRDSGFIKRVKIEDKLFFHADHLQGISFKTLKVGDKLAFRVMETNKGPYAIDVVKL